MLADRADGGRDGRRRRRRFGRRGHPAGSRRPDDPHLDRRRRLAGVPRGSRAAGRDRPPRSPDPGHGQEAQLEPTREHRHRRRRRPRDPRFARQPDRRGRRRPRRRLGRARRGAVGRLDRRPRGGRAARRRQGALRRQGRPRRGRQRDRHDRARAVRARRRRPGRDRRAAASSSTARPNKGELGANAILGVSLACRPRRGGVVRPAALSLPRRRRRQDPAGPDVQHPQRRQARPGLHRLPGVHGHAGRRRDVRRGAAGRLRDLRGPARRSSTTRATRPARATKAGSPRRCRRTRPRSRSSCGPSRGAGYRPGVDVAIALDPATTELVEPGSGAGRRARPATSSRGKAGRSSRASSSTCGPTGRRATRSCRSRTASPRTTGPAGGA